MHEAEALSMAKIVRILFAFKIRDMAGGDCYFVDVVHMDGHMEDKWSFIVFMSVMKPRPASRLDCANEDPPGQVIAI